ncbi:hypothetical protein CDAR_65131 [Caerostris darwini]|uniref:Uncharacterized protein n=1 Tax=Caerostris darwini TaxID=1538125 RepID=A0AAV4VRA8_9ARAC|nr:hypothetical protein CDAR_65131 [Caerostris darwini]
MLAMILGSGFDVTEHVLQTRLIFVRRAICEYQKPTSFSRTTHPFPIAFFESICRHSTSFRRLTRHGVVHAGWGSTFKGGGMDWPSCSPDLTPCH